MSKTKSKVTVFQLIYSALYILLLPFLIFLLSGDWLWPEGWVWCIWYLTLCTLVMVYLYRNDPGLLAERFKKPGTSGEKSWDRYLLIGMMVTQFAWIIVMPLDAKRYGWSGPLPLWLKVIGGVGLFACAFFMYRSYTDNTYLSPLVRIQKDRKQKVVSTGVYGFVLECAPWFGQVLLQEENRFAGYFSQWF